MAPTEKKAWRKDKFSYICVKESDRNRGINLIIGVMGLMGHSISTGEWANTEAVAMLQKIVKNPHFPQSFTVYVESGYVDRVYRDIYYHHYASQHFEQSRNCLRLFFFEGVPDDLDEFEKDLENRLIGISIFQPNGIIGRSYWNPRYFLDKGHYVRTMEYTAMLLNHNLKLPAFPYTMQDQEATTCAEVTLLNLGEYYSRKYFEYPSILLSDIEKVEIQHSPQRIFPSEGMNYADVSRSLIEFGLSPRIYASRAPQVTWTAMQHYLYYYIESGIPFGVAVESVQPGVLHSMVCVGHGPRDPEWPKNHVVNYLDKTKNAVTGNVELQACWIANSADAYQTFVVMDDNNPPYQIARPQFPTKQWQPPKRLNTGEVCYTVEEVCVPLYKRVFLEVDSAAEVFNTFLISQMGYRAVMDREEINGWKKVGESADNPLLIRLFLASSKTFLFHRMCMFEKMGTAHIDENLLDIYKNLYCPRFVWVCELYTTDSYLTDNPQPIGEIVADATAHRGGEANGINAIVLVHYPHYISFRAPDSDIGELECNGQKLDTWSPFEQFRGNLEDYNNHQD